MTDLPRDTRVVEYTPGPWVVDEFYEKGGFYKIRGAESLICHTFAFSATGKTKEADANAALIAAAPEMLQTLRDAERALRDGGTFPIKGIIWELICRAIAKAESHS